MRCYDLCLAGGTRVKGILTSFSRLPTWHVFTVQAMSRLRTNVGYFRINYAVILLLSTLAVMLMNPSSLIVLGGLAAAWTYVYAVRTTPLTIGERTLRCGGASVALFLYCPCPVVPCRGRPENRYHN